MLIRHKIITWFISLSGLMLLLFSFYIYIAYYNYREKAFHDRIRNKALATKEIYDQHDVVAERIITSISEQSEYVFDENFKLIFAINDLRDFDFTQDFFIDVKQKREYFFGYTKNITGEHKDGYAFSFGKPGKEKIIAITAYDKSGLDQIHNLGTILILGNIFCLTLIGFFAYLFARNVLKPVDNLVHQVEAVQTSTLGFRLQYPNMQDEIGIVTASFNKALRRVESLVESQKAFISYASHELRTPLTAISGILETSINYDSEVSVMKNSMKAGHKELQKAIGLINGLLQLANVESAERVIEAQKINILDLLIDTISAFKVRNPMQEFSLSVDDKIAKESYIEMRGNLYLLQTTFFNILDNAAKYSSNKKITISVSPVLSGNISICVIDQGIGIEDADINYVFDPLFRGKNTKGIEGFGLGLALTRRILALHHGEIRIRQNKTEGVTAEIILPAIIVESIP